ncbi:uncharacterized protein LOC119742401 [Patiria miniata]|uniref:Uncharacterized protein n=1 Tax=Patiria miniata TaxID=46514 RepID=A0A914BDU6_PATMI|nr:uncharacterized protein LOC119742401 [Patiria miniata]
MAPGYETGTESLPPSTNLMTEDAPYQLLPHSTAGVGWDDNAGLTKQSPAENTIPRAGDDVFTPSQYTWNLIIGITASVVFVLVTIAALFGLIAFKRYMRKRNRTLSADTGVFSPRRGSKAGLDMIDNAVVLTSHSSLQRSGSLRKQFQKFLSR